MARLLVVRHGQSAWNAEGRWQGWADPPLTAAGLEQAHAAGAALPTIVDPAEIGALVASGLQRATETARIIAATAGITAPLQLEQGLRELDVGDWTGLRRAEIAARFPDLLARWDSGALTRAPGAESREAFEARVRHAVQWVAGLVDDAAPDGARVGLVVTHGRVLGALAQLAGREEEPNRHLCGYWLEVDGDVPFVRVLDRVALLGSTQPAAWEP